MAAIIPFVRPASSAIAPASPGCARVVPFPVPTVPSPAPVPAPAPDSKITDQEKAMKAKINIALRGRAGRPGLYATLAGFCEDVYRFTLQERWGVGSIAKMNVHQLDEVLHWLAELGFLSNRPFYARRDYNRWDTAALIGKVNALLTDKGLKEGRFVGMEYAGGILKNQTRGAMDDIYKASPKQLRAVIAALYRDARLKGRKAR